MTFAKGKHEEIIFPAAFVDVIGEVAVKWHKLKLLKLPVQLKKEKVMVIRLSISAAKKYKAPYPVKDNCNLIKN